VALNELNEGESSAWRGRVVLPHLTLLTDLTHLTFRQVNSGVEVRVFEVFVGDDGGFEGPAEGEFGVVVTEAALVLRRIELGGEVEGFGVVGEREQAGGAAGGDIEGGAVFG